MGSGLARLSFFTMIIFLVILIRNLRSKVDCYAGNFLFCILLPADVSTLMNVKGVLLK